MVRTRPLPLLGLCSALVAGPATAARLQHSEPLSGYRVLAESGVTKPARGEPTTITFNAFSRDFVVELEPNARLAPMQEQLGLAGGASAYRGHLAGRPGSWVRLVLTPEGPAGLVHDGETLYAIEVPTDRLAAGSSAAPTMFRIADLYFAPGELGLDGDAVVVDGTQAVALMATEFTALNAAGATQNLNLGAVADFEFAQSIGADAETALLTRFNNIDGIFSEQLGVQITVAETAVFTASNDPFTATAASALLDELATYRGATPTQDAQGLTHLFTGRDLDGTTVGIAYLGSLCARRTSFDARSFGVGLSEGRRGATIDSLVAAHEIGHNFGAPHDNEAGSPCASAPATFLMAPGINGSDEFSTCSVQQMQPEIAAASCLEPLAGANVAVALPTGPQALAGVAFTRTATVSSLGADAATGVVFTATAQAGLELTAADAGGASCTVAPSSVSCNLGTLAAGAGRDVTLTLRATDIGTRSLTASVTAAQNAITQDDSATIAVNVLPAVDLVLTATPGSVQVNQATTLTATLTNAADFAATAVTVTASLSAGLRPDNASLGGVACAMTGQTIACPARTLAARATATLTVGATGTAAGSEQMSVAATASEAERAPSDNQVAVAVSVSAAPSSDDGGGGATSWWWLAALLAARASRRRQQSPAPSVS